MEYLWIKCTLIVTCYRYYIIIMTVSPIAYNYKCNTIRYRSRDDREILLKKLVEMFYVPCVIIIKNNYQQNIITKTVISKITQLENIKHVQCYSIICIFYYSTLKKIKLSLNLYLQQEFSITSKNNLIMRSDYLYNVTSNYIF